MARSCRADHWRGTAVTGKQDAELRYSVLGLTYKIIRSGVRNA
jgi:hypothetical protein